METEKMKIGNVDFDKDSVLCSKYIYQNGQKLNYVFLIGGTKIMFPDQEQRNAVVALEKEYNNDTAKICTWFNNIKGLIIEESPQHSSYFVR